MSPHVTSDQVWKEIGKNNFGVLGMVTAMGESRTVGICYVVDDYRLYIGASTTQWKTKHIAQNANVSLTIPIARRVPFLPWIKVPAATITFSGTARVLGKEDIGARLLEKLYRHDEERDHWCAIEVAPHKDFITYGLGVSVLQMRFPAKSRARAPVARQS